MANNIIEGHEFVPGAHLEGIVLPRGTVLTRFADLRGIHLEGASLEGAIFRQGVNLEGAFLNNADLFQANLEGANLEGANLQGTILAEANLEDAIFHDANLEDANLDGADLDGADLRFVLNLERALHADTRRAIMDDDDDEEVMPLPPQGRAYEVHNYFNGLDINAIRDFIEESNRNNNDVNRTTQSMKSSVNSLFNPLLHFIDNSDLFNSDEKSENKEKLNRILSIAQDCEGFNANRELLNSIIEFVSKQSDNFIEQYIRIIKDECLNAYGQGGVSCVKGVFERIITTIGAVAIVLTKDESMNQENETYKTLKILFREINLLVQEWATTYLEDGEKEEELKSLSIEERKAHFINFMKTKYGALITPIITEKILEEANEYERTGLFERLYFGGKRKRKRKRKTKNVRKTRKTKNVRKTRKTKKTKKTMKKRKPTKIRTLRRSYKK